MNAKRSDKIATGVLYAVAGNHCFDFWLLYCFIS